MEGDSAAADWGEAAGADDAGVEGELSPRSALERLREEPGCADVHVVVLSVRRVTSTSGASLPVLLEVNGSLLLGRAVS